MKQFNFDISSFEDLRRHNYLNVLMGLFELLELEVKSGNRIVIQRRYTNSDPEIIFVINNLADFEDFKNNMILV